MQSAYLDDLMKDPLLRRFFEAQQPQASAGLPAEPGVVQTHPALPDEPQAGIIQEGPGPGITQEQMRNATPVAASGPPPAPATVPATGPVIDRSGPAMPPEPIPAPPIQADPQTLAMMRHTDPGPQVAGMPKLVDAPDGNILLTGGRNAADHIPASQMPGPKKPGRWAQFKAILPDMITSAMAAGATPSRYGGGPLDIFQGMQVGKAAVQADHDRVEGKARQARLDDLNAAKTRSEIDHANAQGRYYDAEAETVRRNANTKAAQTDRQELFDLMMKYPEGTPEYKHYNKLWLESFSGKQPDEDKLADYSPGVKVNTRTGAKVEFNPELARADRTEQIRRNNKNKAYYSPQMVYDAATPEQQMFIRTGKEPMEKPEKVEKDTGDPRVIMLHPENYTPEQVKLATQMYAMQHRPPEPSQAALDHQETRRVTDQAGRIWAGTIKWLKDNGKPVDGETVRALAIQNASNPQYFPNEENVGGVVAMINKIARTDSLTHKTNTPTSDQGIINTVTGGGGTQPAQPAASTSNGRGGTGQPKSPGAKGYDAYRQKILGNQ